MTKINKQATFRIQTLYTAILLMLFSILCLGQSYGANSDNDFSGSEPGSGSDNDNNNYYREGEPGDESAPSNGGISLPPNAGHYVGYFGLGKNYNNNSSIQYSSPEEAEENQTDEEVNSAFYPNPQPPYLYGQNNNPYAQNPANVVSNSDLYQQNDDSYSQNSANAVSKPYLLGKLHNPNLDFYGDDGSSYNPDYQSPEPVNQNSYPSSQNDDSYYEGNDGAAYISAPVDQNAYSSDQASAQEEAQRLAEEKNLLAFFSWQDMYMTNKGSAAAKKEVNTSQEGFTTTMLDKLEDESEDEQDNVVDDEQKNNKQNNNDVDNKEVHNNDVPVDGIANKTSDSYSTPFNNIIVVGSSNILSFAFLCSLFCILGYALKFPHFYLKV